MSDRPRLILLVDDDRANVEVFRQVLAGCPEKYRLLIASNLSEARRYLARVQPDLVLAGSLLPDGEGIELLSGDPDILDLPVVITTTRDDARAAVEAMKAGAMDFIARSDLSPADLPLVINRLLEDGRGVTERRREVEALRQSEEKFRSIVEQLRDGIVVTNEAGVILEWNHNQEVITGLKREEVIGKPIWEVRLMNAPEEERTHEFLERFRRNRIEILQSIKEGRQTWKDMLNEVDIQRPDGARRSIQSSVFRVMTDDSFLIVSVIRDITDQKRAEENLKSSEERFAKFTAAVTDVIYRYDPINNRYDFISPSFERQTGYTLEELHADPVGVTKNLTHPDDVDQIFNAVDEHIRKGSEAGPIAVQYRVVRKDGRIIWVSDRKDFEFGDDGWVCRINGIVRDITERVQTQERLDSLIRSLPDTILYQTGGGTEYVSSNVENVIGYSVQEISSNRKFFPRLIHPDDRKLLKETHQGWLKSGADGVVEVEFRVKRRDGEYIWMLDRMITAYLTPEGRHSYFGVMIDITRRKQSEEEREKLISELQEALSKIKVLSGLVPICAHCKKIRDDKGYWNQLEDYIAQHSDMVFSHGTCPECARKLYPDYYNEDDDH